MTPAISLVAVSTTLTAFAGIEPATNHICHLAWTYGIVYGAFSPDRLILGKRGGVDHVEAAGRLGDGHVDRAPIRGDGNIIGCPLSGFA